MIFHDFHQQNSCIWKVGDPPLQKGGLCCAIGNFDGVHKGHQKLLAMAADTARQGGLPFCVITFAPHPGRYFRPDDPPFLIIDNDLKDRALAEAGADIIIHLCFDKNLQMMTPWQFVSQVLCDAFDVRHLFAGADFTFGRGREGNMACLEKLGRAGNLNIVPVPLHRDDDHNIITSTRIREAIKAGDIDRAITMLGHKPMISGRVEEGDQRGRHLSFPTANIRLGNCIEPAYGVYAITATLEDETSPDHIIKGVANIGRRPTVNDRGVLVEAHLFDFDRDIYEQRLTLHLHGYLRAELKFADLEALKAQIKKDIKDAKNWLKSENLP